MPIKKRAALEKGQYELTSVGWAGSARVLRNDAYLYADQQEFQKFRLFLEEFSERCLGRNPSVGELA
ncbi:hypothetical protein D9M71_273480 [compost metagenome]